jgi:hypothetical protein
MLKLLLPAPKSSAVLTSNLDGQQLTSQIPADFFKKTLDKSPPLTDTYI